MVKTINMPKINIEISEPTLRLLNRISITLRAYQPGAAWSQSKIAEICLKQYLPEMEKHSEQVISVVKSQEEGISNLLNKS